VSSIKPIYGPRKSGNLVCSKRQVIVVESLHAGEIDRDFSRLKLAKPNRDVFEALVAITVVIRMIWERRLAAAPNPLLARACWFQGQ
jgi:hypothetical protein